MVMSLDRLRPGATATVVQLKTSEMLTRRLQGFGIVPGSEVRCRYRSPGGKVTAIEVMGAVIAVRTKELKQILVECL